MLTNISLHIQAGRTEVIMDNLNPDFVKSFITHYYFEEMQKLRFEVLVLLNSTCPFGLNLVRDILFSNIKLLLFVQIWQNLKFRTRLFKARLVLILD